MSRPGSLVTHPRHVGHLVGSNAVGFLIDRTPSGTYFTFLDSHKNRRNSDANIDTEDDGGRTAFRVASERGYHDIAKLLSDHSTR